MMTFQYDINKSCKMCGLCCYLVNAAGDRTDKPCKYLVRLKGHDAHKAIAHTTLCRIFMTRIKGNLIITGRTPDGCINFCNKRENIKEVKGCLM